MGLIVLLLRLAVLVAVIYVAVRLVRQVSEKGERGRSAPSAADGNKSPYQVLGVSPGASAAEIKAAYQDLIAQYHPDRVANLGVELRELAERRTKEINAAYAQLKARGAKGA